MTKSTMKKMTKAILYFGILYLFVVFMTMVDSKSISHKEYVCIDGIEHVILTHPSGNKSTPIRTNPTGYGIPKSCKVK